MSRATAIRLARIAIVSSWAVFSIHHAYEAGLARGRGPLLVIALSTLILVATLIALARYERIGGRGSFAIFTVATLIWWVGAVGLIEGFYGHTLKDVLYFTFHVPTTALPRSPLGTRYDVPTNFFGEVTGVLPFPLAILTAVAWGRLAWGHRQTTA